MAISDGRRSGRARSGLVISVLASLLFLVPALYVTPRLADGVAYLTGVGGSDYFVAKANGQACDKTGHGCHFFTTGILEHSGIGVSWPGTVAPGSRFLVRAPIWPLGQGRTIISGTHDAWSAIGEASLLYVVGIGFMFLAVRRRKPSGGTRETREPASAR
jgi:hypothetical protein